MPAGVAAVAGYANAFDIVARGEAWVVPSGFQAVVAVGSVLAYGDAGPVLPWPEGLRIVAPFNSVTAIVPDADAWAQVPFLGVTAIVPYPGDEMKIIKTFEHYAPDRQTYRLDFDAKYTASTGDPVDKLLAFRADAGITAAPQIPVGGTLPSGVVKFAVENLVGAGPYKVAMQVSTVGGDRRTGIVEFTVDPVAVFTP